MEAINISEQKTSRELFIEHINNIILSTPKEQKYIIVLIEKLFIDCHKNDCGYSFMDSLCKEYEADGWHIKYFMYMSFIWRHKIVLSRSPIKDYLPHDGYKCSFHETDFAKKAQQDECDAFMTANCSPEYMKKRNENK